MTSTTEHFIVTGVDGSDASIAALQWSVGQAQITGARVRAVTAWHLPYPSYGVPFPTDLELRRTTMERLQRVVDSAVGPDPPVPVECEVGSGSAGPVLVEAADGANLLVVGSRGRGALTGTLLGSVGRFCVSHTSCPTVVVRGDKRG